MGRRGISTKIFGKEENVASENSSARSFFHWISKISEISGIVCAVSVLVSAGVLTYEVLMRYVFKTPTIWEIEFSVYLLIMATFVGAAYGLKHGGHIDIDLITHLLPSRVQAHLSFWTSILSLVFCMVVAWLGWEMWWEAASKGWRSDSLWGPPLWISYLFLPFGMTLLCLQYLVHLSNLWPRLKAGNAEKLAPEEGRSEK
jgi:TRAP-type C4-dicarboxylate transport system permease small subunit